MEKGEKMPRLIYKDNLLDVCNAFADESNLLLKCLWKEFAKMVESVAEVDAKPIIHGHWELARNPMMYQTVPYVQVCSQCGTAFLYKTPYCGECGAKMDEVTDDE